MDYRPDAPPELLLPVPLPVPSAAVSPLLPELPVLTPPLEEPTAAATAFVLPHRLVMAFMAEAADPAAAAASDDPVEKIANADFAQRQQRFSTDKLLLIHHHRHEEHCCRYCVSLCLFCHYPHMECVGQSERRGVTPGAALMAA